MKMKKPDGKSGTHNILILSIGRRIELIQRFKKARDELGVNGEIIVVDISEYAPGLYHGDKYYLVPKVCDRGYITALIDICNNNSIDLIIPTIDTELPVLSDNKEKLEKLSNAKVLVSRKEVIEISRDKFKTHRFFKDNEFDTPKVITEKDIENNEYKFPLFIKPFDGSSSKDTFKINNNKELEFFRSYVSNPMIQEFLCGKEYTIDVFVDFEGNPITIVPRERLETRSGEVSKGIIIKDKSIITEVKRMIPLLRPIGPLTIQCIKDDKKNIKFIEINPRFGGGAPISVTAGADTPKYIYKLLMEEKLGYNEDYKENLVALRYDQSVFLDDEGCVIKND
ncbi:ATP-grasp domain-containing protein [Wukongibacter baidiensis]|uniref:ATP-grasp domain-containing protein n=1 Tax=Wukongibacter baidiensis TaxID=1723361 RepID=UPI003D7FB505